VEDAQLDRRLAGQQFVAGNYLAIWPWVSRYETQAVDLNPYPNVKQWYLTIALGGPCNPSSCCFQTVTGQQADRCSPQTAANPQGLTGPASPQFNLPHVAGRLGQRSSIRSFPVSESS
jgi:hypothetical protein